MSLSIASRITRLAASVGKLSTCGLLACILIGTTTLFAQANEAESQLQQLGRDFLQLQFNANPVYATSMGEHRLDKEYPEFSKTAFNKQINDYKSLRGKLHKINNSSLSPDARIDYLLLESNINEEIEMLAKAISVRDNPKLFSSTAIQGVFAILISPSLSQEEKYERIMARLKNLPDFLKQARSLLASPPELWVVLAGQELETGADFLSDVSAHFIEQFPDEQEEIENRFAEATSALLDYEDFLGNFRDRAGQPFAIGREEYNRRLKNNFFVDYDVDSLQRLGEAIFADLDRRYDSLASEISFMPIERDYEVFVPKTFTRRDILDYYQWEINTTRNWVSKYDYATIPAEVGNCVPMEIPKFLRNVISSAAYYPAGPFDTEQTGYFFVQPLPDSLDDANRSAYFRWAFKRGFRTTVVHEAYPGHHLQFQLANIHPSLIRRIQRNSMMSEGWALYSEQEMLDEGFYEDDPRILQSVLAGQRFRAARIIVDIKLQTGQFTYQQAIDWMIENLDMPLEFVETEVNRYTLTPLQPMTYLVGKLQIEAIRATFAEVMGEDYSLKRFHDMILSEGTIPPMLIYRKISEQNL